jgi:phosphohistidine phosphatase
MEKKTIVLVRHAKSSWADDQLEDFERPLNERGLKDAPSMGQRLHQKGIAPDLILSSPAFRAISTARRMARELAYDLREIHCNTKIYEANVSALIEIIRSLPDELNTVMLVGHNPGMHELCYYLTLKLPEDFPTCAASIIRLDVNQWKQVKQGSSIHFEIDYPKNQ